MQTNHVILNLRGTKLLIERESLMNLPESIMLCLFPNGIILSSNQQQQQSQSQNTQDDTTTITTAPEEDVYLVDFDAKCLDFVLSFFSTAKTDYYGLSQSMPPANNAGGNPLFQKQAIIVLREELEYFLVPPISASSDIVSFGYETSKGVPNPALLTLKVECGKALLLRTSIFTALQRNVNRENNVAEQHLIDMLCVSGFEREDTWGYRSLEPNRCCIASIALVLLKTGIASPSERTAGLTLFHPDSALSQVKVDAAQLAVAQKLLLFWRKPARKCWWDATDVILNEGTTEAREVKVWARRVWTLELSLI